MSILRTFDSVKLNKMLSKMKSFDMIEFCINNVFKNEIAYVCSFGSESSIILHMISKINNEIPVIFLNTKKLFPETISFKNTLIKKFKLRNFKEVSPDKKNIFKYDHLSNLWKENPDKCCHVRKVLPLEKELKNYKAWISGRKGYQSTMRSKNEIVEFVNEKFLISPLIMWNQKKINDYFINNKLKRHPLFKQGFSSIGCSDCTTKLKNLKDARSGRWFNLNKTECGIHLKKK